MDSATSPSATLRQSPPMNSKEFAELQRFIYDLAGIDFPERRKYLLENHLGSRLQELMLRNYAEYIVMLRNGPDRDAELKFFLAKNTNNETNFFGTPSSVRFLRSMS